MIHPTAKVSKQVNRKCITRNMIGECIKRYCIQTDRLNCHVWNGHCQPVAMQFQSILYDRLLSAAAGLLDIPVITVAVLKTKLLKFFMRHLQWVFGLLLRFPVYAESIVKSRNLLDLREEAVLLI